MNIGFITGEFPPMPGGVGHYTRILAERMGAQGHTVRVLTRSGSDCDNVDITGVPGWGLKNVLNIKAWADEHAHDIINLQFQTAAFDMSPWIHFLPSILDQPIVVTFHDLRHPYLFPKAGRLRDWVVTHLARSADGVIATNPEDDRVLAHLPLRSVIPIGSNIMCEASPEGSAGRWRESLSTADSSTLIGHFGFVQAIKGIDFLVDALSELRANGHDVRLLFIGGGSNAVDAGRDNSYRESLEERIRDKGLDDVVYWTGYLPEAQVAACLQEVDVVTLPYLDGASYRRGSLMAAINYGCAIVTTHPTVEHETFVHGENIWLVDRRSAAAISDAVAHLIQNPQTVERLRAGARRHRLRFDWDVIACDTLAFFAAVLRKTGRQPTREDD